MKVGTHKTYKFLILTLILNTNYRFTTPLFDLEGPVLHIALNVRVFHFATN